MYIPIPSQPPPSPRARQLGDKIERTIEEFERLHPNTRSSDIRQALLIARGDQGSDRRGARLAVGLLVTVLLGLIVAFGLVGGRPSDSAQSPPIVMWLIGGLAVLFALIAIARSRGL